MQLYTRMAARERLAGIAMTHSSSVVVPFGGRHIDSMYEDLERPRVPAPGAHSPAPR
jgi:hypothetical protein